MRPHTYTPQSTLLKTSTKLNPTPEGAGVQVRKQKGVISTTKEKGSLNRSGADRRALPGPGFMYHLSTRASWRSWERHYGSRVNIRAVGHHKTIKQGARHAQTSRNTLYGNPADTSDEI